MTSEDIILWKESFTAAAKRATQAGFDILEFHAAHGYGFNQWLSPITNHRTDKYGGNITNNSLLLREIIQQVKLTVPQLLIAVRMPGQDHLEGGLSINDCINLAQLLESEGVDLIDVSSGIGGWKRPRDRVGEGYLIQEASTIQSAIKIPVIGVGGIESGVFIDNIINQKFVSLASVGRAILKDPISWKAKQLCNCNYN